MNISYYDATLFTLNSDILDFSPILWFNTTMARKTRKEKIRAQKRALTNATISAQPQPLGVNTNSAVPTVAHKTAQTRTDDMLTSDEKRLNEFFYSDFKKSIIIIVGILAIEFTLYFSQITTKLLP